MRDKNLKKKRQQENNSYIDVYKRQQCTLSIILYADDVVIIQQTENDLQRGVFILRNLAEEFYPER